MSTELVHVGFGNVLAMNRVLAMVTPLSAPIRRIIQESKTRNLTIDMTNGRKTKAVLFLDSGHIVLAAITPETIAGRLADVRNGTAGSAAHDDGDAESES
ncbi:MAG: DUF370 domain-containing protein [Chloroflexi bacterium]|nr:DUF370 domain-containing protein [Chloroflexota bacterium]